MATGSSSPLEQRNAMHSVQDTSRHIMIDTGRTGW